MRLHPATYLFRFLFESTGYRWREFLDCLISLCGSEYFLEVARHFLLMNNLDIVTDFTWFLSEKK